MKIIDKLRKKVHKKFEYKILKNTFYKDEPKVETLNDLGAQGWELMDIHQPNRYYLKREL